MYEVQDFAELVGCRVGLGMLFIGRVGDLVAQYFEPNDLLIQVLLLGAKPIGRIPCRLRLKAINTRTMLHKRWEVVDIGMAIPLAKGPLAKIQ